MLDNNTISSFQQIVWQFYSINKRHFVWRSIINPYRVVVSEIMLQQTQTFRVAQKFEEFVNAFPDFESLAQAEFKDVLRVWQGLGYNRRAQALHNIAKIVTEECNGNLPTEPEILITFPGIGPNTAGSICAFAFNLPTVFIETNIRAVFLHSFFQDKESVDDKEIIPLVEQTIDKNNPREWYYALMDYGVMLKKHHANPSRKSKHHVVQSAFEGSDRQIRSMILKKLLKHESVKLEQFFELIDRDPERIKKIIEQMCKEKIIKESDGEYQIT